MSSSLIWSNPDIEGKSLALPFLALFALFLLGATSQQQSLHFSAIPSISTYQLGKSTPVSDVASISDSSGSVKFSSPYTLSNTSEQKRIVVKVASDMPSSLAITVSIDQPSGVMSDGPVATDSTDRSLVYNLQRGTYTGQLHYDIAGQLPQQTNGSIKVLYTLNAS